MPAQESCSKVWFEQPRQSTRSAERDAAIPLSVMQPTMTDYRLRLFRLATTVITRRPDNLHKRLGQSDHATG